MSVGLRVGRRRIAGSGSLTVSVNLSGPAIVAVDQSVAVVATAAVIAALAATGIAL